MTKMKEEERERGLERGDTALVSPQENNFLLTMDYVALKNTGILASTSQGGMY
jgi:hypothetical protein